MNTRYRQLKVGYVPSHTQEECLKSHSSVLNTECFQCISVKKKSECNSKCTAPTCANRNMRFGTRFHNVSTQQRWTDTHTHTQIPNSATAFCLRSNPLNNAVQGGGRWSRRGSAGWLMVISHAHGRARGTAGTHRDTTAESSTGRKGNFRSVQEKKARGGRI